MTIKYVKASKNLRTQSDSGQALSRSSYLLPRHTLFWILRGLWIEHSQHPQRDSKQPSLPPVQTGVPLWSESTRLLQPSVRHRWRGDGGRGGLGLPETWCSASATRAAARAAGIGPPVAVRAPLRGQPTLGPLGLAPCSQLQSRPRAPSPRPHAPEPAIQPALARLALPGRCGASRWARGFEELAADAARPHHQDPAPRPRPRASSRGSPRDSAMAGRPRAAAGGRQKKWAAAGSRWGRGGPASVPAHVGRLSAPSGRSPRGRSAGPRQGWAVSQGFTPPVVVFGDAHGRVFGLSSLRMVFGLGFGTPSKTS